MALSPVGQQNTSYDSSPPAATQALRQATVLVVDDEEPVLTNARQLLEALRVTVCTARSTAEALQVIGSVRIDLALVDWRLTAPDDGLALGQLLSREFGIPFVLISGYLDTDATGNAYKLGAADVVDKPLRPERLLAAVNVGLRHQPRVPAHQTFPVAAESGIDSNAERWAHLVLEACRPKDENTEPAAARAAGVIDQRLSRSVLGLRSRAPRNARFHPVHESPQPLEGERLSAPVSPGNTQLADSDAAVRIGRATGDARSCDLPQVHHGSAVHSTVEPVSAEAGAPGGERPFVLCRVPAGRCDGHTASSKPRRTRPAELTGAVLIDSSTTPSVPPAARPDRDPSQPGGASTTGRMSSTARTDAVPCPR